MEAATVPTAVETEGPQETSPDQEKAAAAQPRKELFKWSSWLHVGDGSADCPHAEDGKCQNAEHFHAWCRLPNPYQTRDILEKARAARARKMRTLREPDSDARAILEDDLAAIRDSDARDILINEIVATMAQEILVDATREVMDYDKPEGQVEEDEEGEDGEPPKLYALIDQDMEELARLEALPEDQRGEDFDSLSRHVDGYREHVGKVEEELKAKRRETLEQKSWDELIEIVRKERMDNSAAEAYLNAYQLWQWFACTYKRRGHDERVFKDFNQMKLNTPTDVIEALRETFNDLESRLSRSRSGNS
jgi:hypothetical protein